MSEFFDSKDYADYFRELEERAENKPDKDIKDNTDQPKEPVSKERKAPLGTGIRRYVKKHKAAAAAVCAVGIALAVALTSVLSAGGHRKASADNVSESSVPSPAAVGKTLSSAAERISVPDSTPDPGEGIVSRYVLMLNAKTGEAVTARAPFERTYPASTTKIMTVLVAAEHITDYSETFNMTLEITDKMYLAEATAAGFLKDEPVTMTDLMYGTILPSGGDAALGLAFKISGSEEAFVALMNEKAEQLGLRDTHFTNVTGLFDKDHYTTAFDMAVIMKAAMDNQICRQVLSTHPYTTAKTPQHPDGIRLESTLFSCMYGTEPETATITGGKTGYVNESGFCIASFGKANETGNEYICITLNAAGGKWPSVNDQIALYKAYAK